MRHHRYRPNASLALLTVCASTRAARGFIVQPSVHVCAIGAKNLPWRHQAAAAAAAPTTPSKHASARLVSASTSKLPLHVPVLSHSFTTADTNNMADEVQQKTHTTSKRFLMVPLLYSLASLALIYKSYNSQVTNLNDASMYVSIAALCLFNISSADRKRLVASNKANSKYLGIANSISSPQQIDEAESNRYAAERYAFALAVKTLGQMTGLLRMILDVNPNPSGGAALFMLTQVVYFVVGGGRYRHTDSGRLNPIEDRLVVGAASTYVVFSLAALVAGRTALGSIARSVGTGIFCFGCLTGAFEGVMNIIFGTHRITRSEGKGNC